MQLSRRADYGVRVMLDVAAAGQGAVATIDVVARRQEIPRTFAGKIVSQLAHANLLRTNRGSGGGLSLARPPEEINLRQIIEALEGPIYLNRCLIRPGECPRDRFCPVHAVWVQAQLDLVRRLEAARLSDLVERQRQILASLASGAASDPATPDTPAGGVRGRGAGRGRGQASRRSEPGGLACPLAP